MSHHYNVHRTSHCTKCSLTVKSGVSFMIEAMTKPTLLQTDYKDL